MHKLRINPLAKQDLIEIKEYITKELDNPATAINVISDIIKSYEKLKEFPRIGIELSSKIGILTDYRYLISGNYIIFYKADDIYISIYRILYSRRDYMKILFNE
jgi:addiction module RelE/StbE family toxin